MRQMKDSGIEWIGEIPQEWDVKRIKFTLDERSGGSWGTNEGEGEIDCICVRVADFNYPKLSVDFHDKMTVRSYAQKAIEEGCIKSGDILLEKSGGGDMTPVGRSVLFESNEQMMCANFIEWLRPNQCFNARFLNYWLAAAYANGFSKRNVKQTTGIQNLDVAAFLSERIAAPVVDAQEAIANFLDAKCSEIDALIAAKEKTNALLKERRQSIIYEAVTKGLNPEAPVKDSGIEWIGYIPKHWEVRRLKMIADMQTGTTPPTSNSEYFDGDINWFTPADFNGELLIGESERKLTTKALEEGQAHFFPENTIMFVGIGATVGKIAFAKVGASCNQQITAILLKESLRSKYYAYWLLVCSSAIKSTANYTTLPIINNQHLGETPCPYVCDVNEQSRIVDYLDMKCSEIEDLISANEAATQKLKEYRQSIIYEAVTGKIEI